MPSVLDIRSMIAPPVCFIDLKLSSPIGERVREQAKCGLASSYTARRSFCKANAASVRTCPQLRNARASAAVGETVGVFRCHDTIPIQATFLASAFVGKAHCS